MNFSKKNHELHKTDRVEVSKKAILIISILIGQFSFSQSIYKSSIDSGGDSSTNGNIEVLYTIGEVFVAEQSAGNINLSEGFISAELDINIDPKIFLQGSYDTAGAMFDDLRITINIPTTSPYEDILTCDASVFNATGNDAIVDWVWIEIRHSGDGTTVIASTSALIQVDGDVVDTDGVSLLTIDVPFGNYYLMISHRNHLGILTASTVSLAGGIMSLDLTANSALIEGGTNGVADMGDGNYALFAGDFNGDGQVQNSDKNAVEPLRGISGYENADIDMNSEVQNTDINNALNPNLGRGEQFASRNLKLYAKRSKTKKNN
jgi:hypothetical protein